MVLNISDVGDVFHKFAIVLKIKQSIYVATNLHEYK